MPNGVRYDGNLTTSAKNVPDGASAPVLTLPYGNVSVFSSGTPAVVYQDQALTTPLTQPIQADGQGTFGFWVPAGNYTYSVSDVNGNVLGSYPLSFNLPAGPQGQTGAPGTVTATGVNGDFAVPGSLNTSQSVMTQNTIHNGSTEFSGGGVPITKQIALNRIVSGPGRDSGNPPVAAGGGWTVDKLVDGTLNLYTRGIGQSMGYQLSSYGKGDKAGLYTYVYTVGGADAPSDEGVTGVTAQTVQWPSYFHGTVSSTTGTGDTAPVLVATGTTDSNIGDGSYLLNISKGSIYGKFNGAHTQFSTTQLNQAPVSGVTLPLTTAWGTTTAVFTQQPVSDDIATPLQISVTLGAIGGSNPSFVNGIAWLAGEQFYEQVQITNVQTASSGTQTITVSYRRPNAPSDHPVAVLFQGPLVGKYISLDSNATFSSGATRTCYPAFGSLDGSHLIYGAYVGGSANNRMIAQGSTEAGTSDNGAYAGFHLYPGAEITTTVAGTSPKLEYNSIAFSVGDVIECPHPPFWGGSTAFFVKVQNSPGDPGFGSPILQCAASGTGIGGNMPLVTVRNGNPSSWYRGLSATGSAQIDPPGGVHLIGPLQYGVQLSDAPLNGCINVEGSSYLTVVPYLCWQKGTRLGYDTVAGALTAYGNFTVSGPLTLQNTNLTVATNTTISGGMGPIALRAYPFTVASATTITFSGAVVSHITGTASIQTITPPPVCQGAAGISGCVFYMIADAAWQTVTGGNISTVMTAVAGTLYTFVYDGTNWYIK